MKHGCQNKQCIYFGKWRCLGKRWCWFFIPETEQIASAPVESPSAGSIQIVADSALLNELFALAYRRGHEDTVEGCYIDVHWLDASSYFDDDVKQFLKESND